MVLFHHWSDAEPHTTALALGWQRVAQFGQFGVDLFFALSGFLITGILLDSKTSSNYFTSFYARRTLRIFPLHYAALASVLIALPLLGRRTPGVMFLVDHQIWLWTYTSNIYTALTRSWCWGVFMHFWSLAIEEQFYLVWPLVVFLVTRRGLVWVCGAALLVAAGSRWALLDNPIATYSLTICRIDGLVLGALVALFSRDAEGARWLRRVSGPAALVLGPISAAVYAIPAGSLPWLGVIFRYTIVDAFFAAVLTVALFATGASRFGALLRSGFLRTFGKYSYGIYVVHLMMRTEASTRLIGRLTKFLHVEILQIWGYSVVMTAISFGIAFASYHLFEKHFLRLKDRFQARTAIAIPPAGAPLVSPVNTD
jgi:peptidoglycan/LPS O-acetylase OafA/YrhL